VTDGGGGGANGGGGEAGGRGGAGGGGGAGVAMNCTAVVCWVLPPLLMTAKVQMSVTPVLWLRAAEGKTGQDLSTVSAADEDGEGLQSSCANRRDVVSANVNSC